VAENLDIKLFRSIALTTYRQEFLEELKNRDVEDRRFVAKNGQTWLLGIILIDDPDPEVRRLIGNGNGNSKKV
jgi:hypothetical protein